MNEDQKLVYRMVQGSRERVFRWLESLPPGVLTQQHPDFAYGSLRNIHAHVADCYCNWLGRGGVALAASTASAAEDLPDVTALRCAFAEVDRLMEQAFGEFTDLDTPLEIMWRGPDYPSKRGTSRARRFQFSGLG